MTGPDRRTTLRGAATLGISSLLLPRAAAHATGRSLPGADVTYLAPSGGLLDEFFAARVDPEGDDGPPSAASKGYLYSAGTDGFVNRVSMRGTETYAANATNTTVEFYAATGTEAAPGVGALLGTIPHARTSILGPTYFEYWETTGGPVEIPTGRFWVILRLAGTATGQFRVRRREAVTSTSDADPAWSVVTRVDEDSGISVWLWNLSGSIAWQTPGPFDATLEFVAALVA